MRLTKLLEELEKKGFKKETIQAICGTVYYIDTYSPDRRYIRLQVEYDGDYTEEISELPDGTEYEVDYNRMECTEAFFECNVCYPYKIHDEELGIYVDDVDKYFWRGFEIFDNISKARNEIFKIHSENTEFIENNFVPILKKYDFYNNYDSSFDVEEKINIGSSPMFSWSYMYSKDIEIRFSTNLLTKELEVDGEVWDRNENFEDWFIKNIVSYKLGNTDFIKTEFERFFDDDPKWTPYSFRHILYLSAEIEHIKNHGSSFYKDTIDLSQIPEKYNYLVEEYNKLKTHETSI
jgi:hypothetical protein